jgi:hypothetical protein
MHKLRGFGVLGSNKVMFSFEYVLLEGSAGLLGASCRFFLLAEYARRVYKNNLTKSASHQQSMAGLRRPPSFRTKNRPAGNQNGAKRSFSVNFFDSKTDQQAKSQTSAEQRLKQYVMVFCRCSFSYVSSVGQHGVRQAMRSSLRRIFSKVLFAILYYIFLREDIFRPAREYFVPAPVADRGV